MAHNPLHGSGRAAFPHPVLALGDDAKSPQRVGVENVNRGQIAVDEPPHPIPANTARLTPPHQSAVPETAHLVSEEVERRAVRGHAVIAAVASDNRAQPFAHLGDGVVHASPELGLHRVQLRLQPLANGLPYHRKPSIAPLLPADVREAEKVERLRPPLTTPLPAFGRKRSELHQSRLLGMQF